MLLKCCVLIEEHICHCTSGTFWPLVFRADQRGLSPFWSGEPELQGFPHPGMNPKKTCNCATVFQLGVKLGQVLQWQVMENPRSIHFKACLFNLAFYKGSHWIGLKQRARHVYQRKTKNFIAKLFVQPFMVLQTFLKSMPRRGVYTIFCLKVSSRNVLGTLPVFTMGRGYIWLYLVGS